MRGHDIRESFLDFFADRQHRRYASAPLVPQGDPTLLFVNAGMVPFKDFFLGIETPPSPRATSSQKCLRVSGKHNDLENVGPSARHHTFFEMLGNFSFGDYFKAEAIELAWKLVTEVWELPPQQLYATVFEEDDEAHDLWLRISSLPAERVVRCGKKDNFWAMGDTGPCGPCSELHIDRFPDRPAVGWEEGSESGRYFEFWNLVFMQFERSADGDMRPLPNPSIDTGAGLERLAAVMQGVDSNYDTDLFAPLIAAAGEASGVPYGAGTSRDVSLRVVADHLRAVGFLLADGVIPSNEGRGYVLRRILRRAVRHGMRLGIEEPFLGGLLPVLSAEMKAYPELAAAEAASMATVQSEEEKFFATVAHGSRHLQEAIEETRQRGDHVLEGEAIFRCYDTYGLPVEVAREIAEEEGFSIDEDAFEQALSAQRQRSRQATSQSQALAGRLREVLDLGSLGSPTAFEGYDNLSADSVPILRLARLDGDQVLAVEQLTAGEEGIAVLERTVFYAESGGQVGDVGGMAVDGATVRVLDTQKDRSGFVLHRVRVEEGQLEVGDRVDLRVEADRRRRTERNHTGTHLLHAALRAVLGESVRQAGSLVHPDRLRFDFTWNQPLSADELERVENLANEWIRRAEHTEIAERGYQEAVDAGAMALFGEKYGDRVRTVGIPGFSLELCGGCHVGNTGQIGLLRIVGERGVASGVRRIEALTGDAALSAAQHDDRVLGRLQQELVADRDRLVDEVAGLKERLREKERELTQARMKLALGASGDDTVESEVQGVKILAREVAETPGNELRNVADGLLQRLGSGVVAVGSASGDKVSLVINVSDDLAPRVNAGAVAKRLGALVGGNGGGRRDFAQAGGTDPDSLRQALQALPRMVGEVLAEVAE